MKTQKPIEQQITEAIERGLSRWDAWPDEARILRALLWLQGHGYVGRVDDEWHTREWLAQEKKGAIACTKK